MSHFLFLFLLSLVEVLQRQLLQVPPDLFAEYEVGNNFLLSSLTQLHQNLAESSLPESDVLQRRATQLRISTEQKFGWVISSDMEEEDAPLFVET